MFRTGMMLKVYEVIGLGGFDLLTMDTKESDCLEDTVLFKNKNIYGLM